MTQIEAAEVVVIGAGVTGMCAAYYLAKAGVDVIVVEKELVGWEASGRNGGGVAYHRGVGPKGLLGYEETRLWHTLEDELGYPCEFVKGRLSVALDECGLEALRTAHERDNRVGWRTEMVSARDVRDTVPIINPGVAGGLLDPDAATANPQRTMQALAWAFQDLGGRIHQRTTAIGFTVEADQVVSVETDKGPIGCNFVVDSAGPQTGVLADMVGSYIPVSPGRVEIIVTVPVEPFEPKLVTGNGLYGRQTLRGNLAYGGGNPEWVDVDNVTPEKPNTPMIRHIGKRLGELYAGADDIKILRSWSCVVEQTPDHEPIIDLLESPVNFVVATASADGFGLGPAHGKAISELVMHGETTLPIDAYRLGRFSDLPRDWRDEYGWSAPAERE